MAVVNVNSWTEFLEAAAVSGDTVVCPENAVWDLADIEPEGHYGGIIIRANVNGNGTQIKNLVIENGITDSDYPFNIQGTASNDRITITDLHFLNCNVVCAQSRGFCLLQYADLVCCTFSAMMHGSGQIFLMGASKSLYRCALNLEITADTSVSLGGSSTTFEYLNAKISGSRVRGINLTGTYYNIPLIKNSYLIFDTPQVTSITGYNTDWSVIRCNAANVTTLASFNRPNFCLGVTSDFPNVTTVGAGYLQSIGFPIGADG